MKELSIEEKAKRYDEAIEVARKIKNGESINVPDGTLIPVAIFPELKEGEDERIWIINYLSSRILNSTIIAEKENLKKAIAWVEKQGEQKPAEEYNITGIGSKNAQGKLGEMIKNLKSAWSEEDEDMCYKATAVINRLCDEGKEYVWSVNTLKKLFYWLKSLKERYTWKPSEEQLNALHWCVMNVGSTEHQVLQELLEQLEKLKD